MSSFTTGSAVQVAVIAALGCAASAAARAQTVQYSYVGPNYTEIVGTGITTSDHIRFAMMLAAPLAPNLTHAHVRPTAWVMSNGVAAFGSSTPKTKLLALLVSTDENGKIIRWNIQGEAQTRQHEQFLAVTQSNSTDLGAEVMPNGVYSAGVNMPGNGTWTSP
jgi:hypothetical protein